uniref:RNase H type-1 domain-containing protein n=1 Tax=Cannabis sativa TaxID=3483 RepID=A0A803P0Z7_CANSA
MLMLNVDARVREGLGEANISMVMRDQQGRSQFAAATFVAREMTPLQAKLQAIIAGIQTGIQQRFCRF